jgi:hypothetical protein
MMHLLSTQIFPNEKNQFSPDHLLEVTGKIRLAIIISAYTDVKMLNTMIKKIRKLKDKRSCVVQIYLDYWNSGYTMVSETREKLDKIAKSLKEISDKSGVWLVRDGRLFHSKLVMIETNTESKMIVGSLNMTSRAFSVNEELIVMGSGSLDSRATVFQMGKWVKDLYCPCLQEKANELPKKKISEPERGQDIITIREILMAGRIFHEIKENDPFRFQLGLPEKYLKITQDVHPLLEAKMVDSISLLRLLTGSSEEGGLGVRLPPLERNKVSWKKFCIDTCYGYWCPPFLIDDAKEALDQKEHKRKLYYESLFTQIKEKKDDLTSSFFQVAEILENRIIENRIKEFDWTKESVKDHWGKWYERLLKKLDLEEFRIRVIQGIEVALVPNVWSDPLSAREFENSFAESLIYGCTKGAASQFRKVVKDLIDNYDLDEKLIRESTPEEVIKHIEGQALLISDQDLEGE